MASDASIRSGRGQPASVLDRLLDFEPDRGEDMPQTQRQRLRALHDSIRRDLETLLNTQQPPTRLAAGKPEIGSSLVQYGSPGFHGLMLANRQQHLALARSLQDLISTFEPRLKSVRVLLGEDKVTSGIRSVRLRIHAETRFEDLDEPVVFDTQIDPATRQFRVGGGAGNG